MFLGASLMVVFFLLGRSLRVNRTVPPFFVEQITNLVQGRKFNQAFGLARVETSLLARLLATGMGRLQLGLDEVRLAVSKESEKWKKKSLVFYVGMVGIVSLLIGLIAFLWNAIKAVKCLPVLDLQSSWFFEYLLHGLGYLFYGACLSGFAICGYLFFRRRLEIVVLETMSIADALLAQMHLNASALQEKEPRIEAPEV